MTADVENYKKSRASSNKTSFNWERLLRKFSEGRKLECKNVPQVLPTVKRGIKYFPTGSSYDGTWNILGMSGRGVYTYPNGTKYEGEFRDGEFHGEGKMSFDNGCVIHGRWKHGEIVEKTLVFDDGLAYDEHDWQYCKMPDRRFNIEHENGIPPAGESHITAYEPPREIPLGMYDTGDGLFDPISNMIHDYNNYDRVLRAPHKTERDWIMRTNRVNPITTIGPRPDLFEQWLTIKCSDEMPPKQEVIEATRSALNEREEILLEGDISQSKQSVDRTDSISERVYCSFSSSSDDSTYISSQEANKSINLCNAEEKTEAILVRDSALWNV